MKFQKIFTGILIVSMVLAFSIPAAAQGGGRGKMGTGASVENAQEQGQGQMKMRMGKGPGQGLGLFHSGLIVELNLTEDQEAAIDDILAVYKEQAGELVEVLVSARLALATVIHTDGANETAVREASQVVASYKEALNVLRGGAVSEIAAVLSEEQVAVLHEWQAQRLEAQEERLNSMQEKMDEWLESQTE